MAPTRTRISLTALMLAAALAACSDANDPGDRRVSTVEVTPDALLLEAIGATGQLTATAKDISGNRIPGHTPEWTNPNGSDPAARAGWIVRASWGLRSSRAVSCPST